MTSPIKHHWRRMKAGIDWRQEALLDIVRLFGTAGCSFAEAKRTAVAVQIGSQAVLHHSLHHLIDSGYLNVRKNPSDGRRRLLRVTGKGLNLLGAASNE